MEHIISKLLAFFSRIFSFIINRNESSSRVIDADVVTIDRSHAPRVTIREHQFFGGESSNYVDISLGHLISAKNYEEFILEKKKKSFFARVVDIINSLGLPQDHEKVKDFSNLTDKELLKLLKEWNLDAQILSRITRAYNDIENSKSLIRSYESRIRCIIGAILKKLRNFKEIFKRQHSFHFKNLDDYHSLTLINY